MKIPSLETVQRQSEGFAAFPVSCEIFADIKTPIQVLKILKSISSRCYLLESVEGVEKWGRYSFLGFDPVQGRAHGNQKRYGGQVRDR